MEKLLQMVRGEPVMLVGLMGSLVDVLTSFGVPMSEKQVGSLMALLTIGGTIVARSMVTPNHRARRQLPKGVGREGGVS